MGVKLKLIGVLKEKQDNLNLKTGCPTKFLGYIYMQSCLSSYEAKVSSNFLEINNSSKKEGGNYRKNKEKYILL